MERSLTVRISKPTKKNINSGDFECLETLRNNVFHGSIGMLAKCFKNLFLLAGFIVSSQYIMKHRLIQKSLYTDFFGSALIIRMTS